jgi:hypothetical protein
MTGDKTPTTLGDLVGRKLFIRTVTYHLTGEVTGFIGDPGQAQFLVLSDAAWIADSGRFHQAISQGTLSEVEPVGDAFVNVASITDIFPWNHELPTTQK